MSSDPNGVGRVARTARAARIEIGEIADLADLGPDLLAARVLTVPGVVSLHGGAFGEVATYLPGRTVRGIRIRPDGIHVHVVLRAGVSVRGTADAVRRAIHELEPSPDPGADQGADQGADPSSGRRLVRRPVHVTVEDVEP